MKAESLSKKEIHQYLIPKNFMDGFAIIYEKVILLEV